MQATTIERERCSEVAATTTPSYIPRRRTFRAAPLWSAAGFLAGALFWYAAAFWGFISDVVFDAAPRTGAMAAVARPSQVSLPTIYLVDPANCTALILDRKMNSTVMKPCPEEGLALRLEANSGRESLAIAGDPRMVAAHYPAD